MKLLNWETAQSKCGTRNHIVSSERFKLGVPEKESTKAMHSMKKEYLEKFVQKREPCETGMRSFARPNTLKSGKIAAGKLVREDFKKENADTVDDHRES